MECTKAEEFLNEISLANNRWYDQDDRKCY